MNFTLNDSDIEFELDNSNVNFSLGDEPVEFTLDYVQAVIPPSGGGGFDYGFDFGFE